MSNIRNLQLSLQKLDQSPAGTVANEFSIVGAEVQFLVVVCATCQADRDLTIWSTTSAEKNLQDRMCCFFHLGSKCFINQFIMLSCLCPQQLMIHFL